MLVYIIRQKVQLANCWHTLLLHHSLVSVCVQDSTLVNSRHHCQLRSFRYDEQFR